MEMKLYKVWSNLSDYILDGNANLVFVFAIDEENAIHLAYSQYFPRVHKDYMEAEEIELQQTVQQVLVVERYFNKW